MQSLGVRHHSVVRVRKQGTYAEDDVVQQLQFAVTSAVAVAFSVAAAAAAAGAAAALLS